MPIKALIFDRDGTLIEHVPYLSDPEQVILLPEIKEGLSTLLSADFLLFLHTNQSGVGRGMFEMGAVHACNQRLVELLDLGPRPFGRICIAPEKPGDSSLYRKPSPQFAREIIEEFSLTPTELCYLGDRSSDLQTAVEAGTHGIGIDTGQGDLGAELTDCGLTGRFPVLSSFSQAVDLLLKPPSP